MARTHVQTQQQPKRETPEGAPPQTQTEGNVAEMDDATGDLATPGIEAPPAGMPNPYQHSAVRPDRPDAPKVRRYEVTNARDVPILYNGCHSTMRAGKIIDDVAFDIESLRRQGVKLQEITEGA